MAARSVAGSDEGAGAAGGGVAVGFTGAWAPGRGRAGAGACAASEAAPRARPNARAGTRRNRRDALTSDLLLEHQIGLVELQRELKVRVLILRKLDGIGAGVTRRAVVGRVGRDRLQQPVEAQVGERVGVEIGTNLL